MDQHYIIVAIAVVSLLLNVFHLFIHWRQWKQIYQLRVLSGALKSVVQDHVDHIRTEKDRVTGHYELLSTKDEELDTDIGELRELLENLRDAVEIEADEDEGLAKQATETPRTRPARLS